MGADMEWPVCLDEYQKLVNRMNTPRVVLDNDVCDTATVIKVDSVWKNGVLLEAVQVLADLNLSVNKAYFSSDGRWFMDVFHVTDQQGRKLTDESIRSYIEQILVAGTDHAKADSCDGLVALELAGDDRPGLLSEVLAVLEDQQCDVVDANMWTHNGRVASLIHVKDEGLPGASAVEVDPRKLQGIEERLRNVLAVDGAGGRCTARLAAGAAASCMAATHADRRLHQMFFADSDCELAMPADTSASSPPSVSVQRWVDRGYSAVSVQCRDRPKLLFDVVCTLTDMDYVVFHGTVDTDGDRAHQEFYIRHVDGSPVRSEAERQRVIRCLQAAVQRRTSEGVRLELSAAAADERGFLTGVTRALRENGLSVARAEVSAAAHGFFYVTDASGYPADAGAVEAARQRVGLGSLSLAEPPRAPAPAPRKTTNRSGLPWEERGGVAGLSYLGSLVRRNLYNLGLIKSCS